MNSYKLKIITPEKIFFDGDVTQIVVRTSEGNAGFLSGHIDYVSHVVSGPLKVRETDEKKYRTAALSDGIIIVSGGDITILPEAAEWSDEIDLERAERAKKAAEEKIKSSKKSDSEFDMAQVKLKRALARISVYNQTHSEH